MDHVYVTPAEAREVYAEQHNIPIEYAPTFPPGCKEYADYVTRVREELKNPHAWDFLDILDRAR